MGASGHFSFDTLIDAGFVLYRKNPANSQYEYLLLQKSNNLWGSPKGHVADGELEYQVAVRTAKDEVDLEEGNDFIAVPDFKHGIGYEMNKENDGPKMYLVNLWLGEMINKDYKIQLSSDYQAYKWLKLDDAIECFGATPRDICWISCLKRCNEFIQKE